MMRACKKCDVRWPTDSRFKVCPCCEGATKFDARHDPSPGWEEHLLNLQAANSAMPAVEARKADERLTRFQEAGLDMSLALEYAADPSMDLHLFERLRRQGCPLHLAIEIVSPLARAG